MLLSALAIAALLQASPAALTLTIPDAAPVVGQKHHLLQRRPFNSESRVDQLRMPYARRPHAITAEAARALASGRPATPRRPKFQPSPQGFVRGPLMPDCDRNGLTSAGHPETQTVQPLSKMPNAHAERAVVRLVDGCPVAVLIAQRTPAR
jgi:hypothetical protein